MSKKGVIIFYAVALVLLLIGFFYDAKISEFISAHRIPFLNQFMIWVSLFGTWFFVFIIMTSLFMFQENKREWIIPLWTSVISTALMVYVLKLAFVRLRPFMALDILNLEESSGSSFPSGHSAAVFSTIAILDKEFPRIKIFWLIFACLVAFSRIYLGLHYLTDVVAGAVIGFTISLIVTRYSHIFRFLKSKKK